MQQHYKGSTSTPPRVARLCQIREASLVALRKFLQIYACSHVSIVRLVQPTIPVSSDSHSYSSPLYHLPGELVSITSVPIPSIDLNLRNRSRPSNHHNHHHHHHHHHNNNHKHKNFTYFLTCCLRCSLGIWTFFLEPLVLAATCSLRCDSPRMLVGECCLFST